MIINGLNPVYHIMNFELIDLLYHVKFSYLSATITLVKEIGMILFMEVSL